MTMKTNYKRILKTLTNFALKEAYKRVERLGDRLAELESVIDWEAFLSPDCG